MIVLPSEAERTKSRATFFVYGCGCRRVHASNRRWVSGLDRNHVIIPLGDGPATSSSLTPRICRYKGNAESAAGARRNHDVRTVRGCPFLQPLLFRLMTIQRQIELHTIRHSSMILQWHSGAQSHWAFARKGKTQELTSLASIETDSISSRITAQMRFQHFPKGNRHLHLHCTSGPRRRSSKSSLGSGWNLDIGSGLLYLNRCFRSKIAAHTE